MSYKIVADSCCEFPEGYEKDSRYERVALRLDVEDEVFIDDESFDQAKFLKSVAKSAECPKSSCPSPEAFREAYHTDAENVFVFTLSSHLSGSYNSAELGKKLYHEKYGDKNIFVCDSESASCGETQLAFKTVEWSKEGCSFEEICQRLVEYRDKMKTYFVLDNLETLRKNGRMSGVKAFVASALNIKPVMGSDTGEIILRTQTIGVNKALGKMAQLAAQEAPRPQERRLIITHCNAPDRAEQVKKQIMARAPFQECIIMDTRGVSSMYANDGGVIVTT